MKNSYCFNGKEFRIFDIENYGNKHRVIVVPDTYQFTDSLALRVDEIVDDPDFGTHREPYAVLTVAIDAAGQNATDAFVKAYSENAQWAKDLCRKLEAKPLGVKAQTGFVTCELYRFDVNKCYAE